MAHTDTVALTLGLERNLSENRFKCRWHCKKEPLFHECETEVLFLLWYLVLRYTLLVSTAGLLHHIGKLQTLGHSNL